MHDGHTPRDVSGAPYWSRGGGRGVHASCVVSLYRHVRTSRVSWTWYLLDAVLIIEVPQKSVIGYGIMICCL